MNTKQLPYILAIEETKNLSLAAKKVGVSQPALSKYLAGLEDELKLQLFYRSKKQLLPTEAGLVYIDAARRIVELEGRTRASITSLTRAPRSTLRIGVTPHRGAQVIAATFPSLISRFPDVEFRTIEGYSYQQRGLINDGQIDLALTTTNGTEQPDFTYLPSFNEELVLGVPSFHKLARFASHDISKLTFIDLAEFRDTPFVRSSDNTTIFGIERKLFKEVGFDPTTVFRSDNILVVNEMLKSGVGVGLLPAFYVKPSNDVVYFRLKQPAMFTSCMLYLKNRKLTLPERYLIYLKVKNFDLKHIHNLTSMCWTDELREIIREFEPGFDFNVR